MTEHGHGTERGMTGPDDPQNTFSASTARTELDARLLAEESEGGSEM